MDKKTQKTEAVKAATKAAKHRKIAADAKRNGDALKWYDQYVKPFHRKQS